MRKLFGVVLLVCFSLLQGAAFLLKTVSWSTRANKESTISQIEYCWFGTNYLPINKIRVKQLLLNVLQLKLDKMST